MSLLPTSYSEVVFASLLVTKGGLVLGNLAPGLGVLLPKRDDFFWTVSPIFND